METIPMPKKIEILKPLHDKLATPLTTKSRMSSNYLTLDSKTMKNS